MFCTYHQTEGHQSSLLSFTNNIKSFRSSVIATKFPSVQLTEGNQSVLLRLPLSDNLLLYILKKEIIMSCLLNKHFGLAEEMFWT